MGPDVVLGMSLGRDQTDTISKQRSRRRPTYSMAVEIGRINLGACRQNDALAPDEILRTQLT
jgi:hypothetical protein